MTFLSTLLGEPGVSLTGGRDLAPRANVESPLYPLTSQTLVDLLVGPKSDAGVTVTEKGAFGLPAVYRAIALIAGSVAGLPLHAYRADGDQRRRLEQQPAILTKPHPDLTQFEWTELVMVHLLGWGNAYLFKVRDRLGNIVELWPLPPGHVVAGRTTRTREKVYGWGSVPINRDNLGDAMADGLVTPFTDREVLHIPGLGYDGVQGLSPIAAARNALGTAAAAEVHGARFFGSGTMLSGILSTEQRISPTTADELKDRWTSQVAGINHAHEVAVLGHGTKFEPISISPADAQFIETQKFGIQQVARLYGVPPHMLMDTEKSTSWGTGIEQQTLGYVMFSLRTWLIRFEQRLDRVIDPDGKTGAFTRFAVEGLLRGATKDRFEAYTLGRNGGWLSVNDIRRLEDQEPVDGGDEYLVPLNMKALGSEATLRERVEMAAVLIRAGYTPEAATAAVGLPGIDHTGLLPVTLQKPEDEQPAEPPAGDPGEPADDDEPADDTDEEPTDADA